MERFLLVLIKFSFWEEDYNSTKFDIFLVSPSATREATRIYYTYYTIVNTYCILYSTNNHASFLLWWQKNLVEYQKISKCYDYYCSPYNLFVYLVVIYEEIIRATIIVICIKPNQSYCSLYFTKRLGNESGNSTLRKLHNKKRIWLRTVSLTKNQQTIEQIK